MVFKQRKLARLSANSNTFAALDPEAGIVGRLKDITTEGAAIEYIADEKTKCCSASYVDIFLFNQGCNLTHLPCRFIYETLLSPKSDVPAINKKQCGIKFINLTQDQTDQLVHFINSHTSKKAATSP